MEKHYKQTKEHREKISESNKGKKKKPFSAVHREKIRQNRIGTKHSEDTKAKMSAALKGKYTGEKSSNWKGGICLKKGTFKIKKLSDRERLAGRKRPDACEVCGAFGSDTKHGICFDHDHSTGEFRGWLCGRCNIVLGFAKDSPELLNKLALYLTDNYSKKL